MKQVTQLLINDFKIKELGYDFMGFSLQKNSILSFHHLIQRYEDELFRYITSEMIDMKAKGYLDVKNLIAIGQILDYFEYKHIEDKTDKGHYLIKEKYLNRNRFE